ncbi:MAG: hypothetical protein IJU68_07275 [Bacteroidales bacterium]|nr:hypothetical protein [Bacteroidales bacterium]
MGDSFAPDSQLPVLAKYTLQLLLQKTFLTPGLNEGVKNTFCPQRPFLYFANTDRAAYDSILSNPGDIQTTAMFGCTVYLTTGLDFLDGRSRRIEGNGRLLNSLGLFSVLVHGKQIVRSHDGTRRHPAASRAPLGWAFSAAATYRRQASIRV